MKKYKVKTLVPDLDNAIGYAESQKGKVLILNIDNSDIWEATSEHIQVKDIDKIVLIAILDGHGEKLENINKKVVIKDGEPI